MSCTIKTFYRKWRNVSSPFKFFLDDWVDMSEVFENSAPVNDEYVMELPINLGVQFFENLKLDQKSIEEYKVNAAISCAKTLGSDIALALSGGIDSQATMLAFKDAGVDFTPYVLSFNNMLNCHDVEHAKKFCKYIGYPIQQVNIDINKFLNRENYELGLKYQSASPHFNVHYKLFDWLQSIGHTGVVCGGQIPIKNISDWGINFRRNNFNFINYTNISGFRCQGSFLSFDPKLCWAMALNYKDVKLGNLRANTLDGEDYDKALILGYAIKVNAYIRSGFNIIPQKRKYTGFELVKQHYASKSKDGWSFEKQFRKPLTTKLKIYNNRTKFALTDQVKNKIDELYYNNTSESVLLKKYINVNNSYAIEPLKFDYMRSWL